MTIENAIRKAIEGGYEPILGWMGPALEREYPEIFPDPDFWRALGEAMGWSGLFCIECGDNIGDKDLGPANHHVYPEWLHYWHCFIDDLAAGKSPEEFFESFKEE